MAFNKSESIEITIDPLRNQLKSVIGGTTPVQKKQVVLSYMDHSSHLQAQSQPLTKNSSAPILNLRLARDQKSVAQVEQNIVKTEKKLPQLKDNRLYYHYQSNNQVKKQQQPTKENNQNMKFRMIQKRRSEGCQEVIGPNEEGAPITITQDEESRVFQRFLKTFSTNNWSEFANKVLDKDKNQGRENLSTAQVQTKQKKFSSRNNQMVALPQNHAAYNSVGNNSNSNNNNINHYIKTFGSFKQYQWQKLNFDLNTNRAPQTIKNMVKASQVQEDIKAQRLSIQRENTLELGNEQNKAAFLTEMTTDEIYCKDSSIEQPQIGGDGCQVITQKQSVQQHVVNTNQKAKASEPYKHETRYQKFKKESEIVQLKSSLKQLNMLQQIGSVNILKEYKYPGSVDDIVKFIKDKDLDLYEKILQTKNLAKKRIEANPQMDSSNLGALGGGGGSTIFSNQKYSIKEKEFSRLFTMNERQQVIVLKEWLDFMIEHYVKYDGQMSSKRLQNEQLILAFTLSDLKDQMSVECLERGEIMDKVLALVFDMFRCYEQSFDVIIQEEVGQYKQTFKAQVALKDEILRKKDKDIEKAQMKFQDKEQALQNKDYTINALIAKNKGLEIRFKVMKNLIDNLIFSYKQRISQDFEKSKLERQLARTFIRQLKELKKYGNKSEQEQGVGNNYNNEGGEEDDMLLAFSDEERIKQSMKRKVDRSTQTENMSVLIGSLFNINGLAKKETTVLNANNLDSKLTTSSQKKKNISNKKKRKTRQKKINKNANNEEGQSEFNDIVSEIDQQEGNENGYISEGQENDDTTNQVQEDDDQLSQKSKDSNTLDEEVKIDLTSTAQDIGVAQDQLVESVRRNSDLDSDINTDDEQLKAQEEEENQQETIRFQQQREAMLEAISQYSPDMLLEIISFYNSKTLNFTEQVGVQTEECDTLSPLRGRQFRNSVKKIVLTNKVISGFSPQHQLQNSTSDLGLSPNESFDKKGIQLKSLKSDNSYMNQETRAGGMKRTSVLASVKTGNGISPSGKRTSAFGASDEDISPSIHGKFSNQTRLNVDEIILELSNLDLNDLNQLLSSDKQYNKVSMSFLQNLVQQLKKTTQFKHLIEKAAKDKIRGSWKKEKQKQEKQDLKSGSKLGSKSKTQKNLMRNSNTQSAIAEESSSSSNSDGGASTERNHLHSNSKKLVSKRTSVSGGGGNSSTNKNKKRATKSSNKMVEKSTQYEISNEEYERIKRSYMNELASMNKSGDTSVNNNSTLQFNNEADIHQLSQRIDIQALDNSSLAPESASKKKLKHIAHLVGRMSIAFSNKTNLLGGDRGITPKSNALPPNGAPSTLFAPFNLGQERQSKAKQNMHPMGKFLPVFIEKYKQNNKAFLNVNQMTQKLVLKMIIQFYYDKVTLSKDSSYIKSQNIGEFLYDQLFNKYGIANITEKKIKELLMSVMIYRTTNLTASLFAKFMMLEDDPFSNDDLGFLYRLNKRLVQNDAFQIGVRREYNFDSPNIVFQVAFDVVMAYMQIKLSPKTLHKFQEDLQLKLKDYVVLQQQSGMMLIATERFFEAIINGYQYIKFLIFEQMRKKFDIASDDDPYPQILLERQFDCDTFLKILATYNDKGQLEKENPYQLFEANRVFISGNQATTAIKDDEKRISLEGVIALIFKFDLIYV